MLFDPLYDDYTAVLSVVATLLIIQLDSYDSSSFATDPPAIGIASWWLRNIAYYGMFGTLIMSIAGSYAEIGLGRRNSLFLPTAILAFSTLVYLVDRELQSIIRFSGMTRLAAEVTSEWESEGFDTSAFISPPVSPHVRDAFYAGELVPLNLFILLSPLAVWHMLHNGTPYEPAARKESDARDNARRSPAPNASVASVAPTASWLYTTRRPAFGAGRL